MEVHFITSNSGAVAGGGVTVLKNLLSWTWPVPVTLHFPGSARRLWEAGLPTWVQTREHPDWRVWEFRGSRGYGPGKSAFDFDSIPRGAVVVIDSQEALRQLVPGLGQRGCRIVHHMNSPEHCLKRNPVDSLRDVWRYRKLDACVFASCLVESRFRKDPLAKLFLRRLKGQVIYSGIFQAGMAVPAKYPGARRIAYLGRYETYKNPLFLQDLGWEAVYMGSALGCSQPVEIPKNQDLGWQADLDAAAMEAEVFVYPSVNEAFGLVVIEMMARGKIPICFRSGAFPEIVQDGVNGFLIEPFDVAGARRVLEWLEDAELRARMSRAALESAARFSIKAFGEGFWSLLKNGA